MPALSSQVEREVLPPVDGCGVLIHWVCCGETIWLNGLWQAPALVFAFPFFAHPILLILCWRFPPESRMNGEF